MTDVVRLRITLCDTEPLIWRTVDIPIATTLPHLHRVIQAAMGWEGAHLYQFQIGGLTINGQCFDAISRPSKHRIDAARLNLDELIADGLKHFIYRYDMGDNWEHEVRIEKVLPGDPSIAYPIFVAGAGKCPPEDVGGPSGFCDFLKAMANPKHRRHGELTKWHGGPFDPKDLDEAMIGMRLSSLSFRNRGKSV